MTEKEIRNDERKKVYAEVVNRRNYVVYCMQEIPLQWAQDVVTIQLAFARAGIHASIGFCKDRDVQNWPIIEVVFGPFYNAKTNQTLNGSASYDPEERTYSYYIEFGNQNYSGVLPCDVVDEKLIMDL